MTMLEMAAEYRRAGDMIRLRMLALQELAQEAEGREKRDLLYRIRYLSAMYRDTRAVARVLENYYDRGYHIDEHYTV